VYSECLLNAGANINARSEAGGTTVLHHLAYTAIFKYSGVGLGPSIAPGVILSGFSFLVEQGADPAIIAEGRTAVDILREAMAAGRIPKYNKQHVLALIDFLQEKKGIPK
jgi:hypothetical protein